MKIKLLLSLLTTLLTIHVGMAQKPDDSYSLYGNPNYYKGKTVYFIKDRYHRQTIGDVFKKPTGEHYADNVPYPEHPRPGMTIYYSVLDSLLGKKFICQDMVEKIPYTFLKLYNEKTGEIYLEVDGREYIATLEQLRL